jgi:ATP-dependent helicase HrpA
LPAYLRLRIRVIDATGHTLGVGYDLQALSKAYADVSAAMPHGLAQTGMEREGLTDWDVPDIPESVETRSGDIRLPGFPALVDCGSSVALRILDSRGGAESAHRAGVRRLIMLRLTKAMRDLRRHLPGLQKMRLQYAQAPQRDAEKTRAPQLDLQDQLIALIVDLTFLEGRATIRARSEFEARIADCKGQLTIQAKVACALANEILEAYQAIRKRLADVQQGNWQASAKSMREQLDDLVFQGFLQHTSWVHLLHYPRYLAAMRLRLDKLRHAAARDGQWQRELQPLVDEWQERDRQARRTGLVDPRLQEIRWMLEELRVSRFAQELKTPYPVSVQRVRQRWEALGL